MPSPLRCCNFARNQHSTRRYFRALLVATPLLALLHLAILANYVSVPTLPSILTTPSRPQPPRPPSTLQSPPLAPTTPPSPFLRKEDIGWTGVSTHAIDACVLFPVHLLASVQIVLVVSATEHWTRTAAQVEVVSRCVPSLLVVSDVWHAYGLDRVAVDGLVGSGGVMGTGEREAWRLLGEKVRFGAREDGDSDGDEEEEGEFGGRWGKYKILPALEAAGMRNPKADWYVFIGSETYVFWDGLFRFLEMLDPGHAWWFGTTSFSNFSASSDNNEPTIPDLSAGTILSRTTLRRLIPQSNTLPFPLSFLPSRSLTSQYAALIRSSPSPAHVLSSVLTSASVKMSNLYPMLSTHSFSGLSSSVAEERKCTPVLSLGVDGLEEAERVKEVEDGLREGGGRVFMFGDLVEEESVGEGCEGVRWVVPNTEIG